MNEHHLVGFDAKRSIISEISSKSNTINNIVSEYYNYKPGDDLEIISLDKHGAIVFRTKKS